MQGGDAEAKEKNLAGSDGLAASDGPAESGAQVKKKPATARKQTAADEHAKPRFRLSKHSRRGTMAIRGMGRGGGLWTEVNVKGASLEENTEIAKCILEALNRGTSEVEARLLLQRLKDAMAGRAAARQ